MRERSAAEVHKLVDAARTLAAEGGPGFTVQEVVALAGVSVRTLYRYFSGKDELLLAVFEEDNRQGVAIVAEALARQQDPKERLRTVVVGLFELAVRNQSPDYTTRVLHEYLRLATGHAAEVQRVLTPFVDLLKAELEAAARAGVARVRDPEREAALIFALVFASVTPLLLTGMRDDPGDAGELVWAFCYEGLHPRTAGTSDPPG